MNDILRITVLLIVVIILLLLEEDDLVLPVDQRVELRREHTSLSTGRQPGPLKRVESLYSSSSASGAFVAVRFFQSHSISNIANVSQRAALAALQGPMDAVWAMRDALDRPQIAMHTILSQIPGVETLEPEGAFYAFASVPGLLGRPLAGMTCATSAQLAQFLLDEIEIAVVPGEAFGAPGYCRLSFALSDADLAEGLERWRRLAAS